jgi:hypothetical protein
MTSMLTALIARRTFGATLLILAALTGPGAAGARVDDGRFHGCGVLVDAAHPWQSHVPSGHVETGNRWLTARAGRLSTCAFASNAIHRLLALPPRTYAGRDVGRLLGGICHWDAISRHETIRPFALIVCHLPTPSHPRIAAATVEALVDPDPSFIH